MQFIFDYALKYTQNLQMCPFVFQDAINAYIFKTKMCTCIA